MLVQFRKQLRGIEEELKRLTILEDADEELFTPIRTMLEILNAFLGAGVDMHRANEIRPLMKRISVLAEKYQCAIILIGHMNKNSNGKSSYRGLGSIDFQAAARSVLIVGIVEGKLHIQVRFSDILNTDNHGYVYLKNEDGKVVNCQSSVAFWDQSHVNSYEEFVFEVSAEELVNYEIWGEFWTCNNAPIEGEWQVTFPVEKNE